MILQSLNLHNFMSYADARLDLSSINVACLSGANGAGKSALLDATTWTIWEAARASSDELIRLGEKEMWVDLVFSHEGNTYRIRRSRQRAISRSGNNKTTSKGTLDFQMLASNNSSGEHWKSLTSSSIRETQQKICELLRMDYQTFVNSAYLRQGAADQFARETPMKRKEILGEILSLSYFDRLQERCKEKLKPLKEKCESLSELLARLPELEDQIKQLEKDQFDLKNRLTTTKQNKESLETEYVNLQRKEHELNSWQEKQKNIKTQLATLEQEINLLLTQENEFGDRLLNLQVLTHDQAELESELAQYEQITNTLKDLEEKSFTAQNLEKQKSDLRAKLSEERTKIELDLKQAEKEAAAYLERKLTLLRETEDRETISSEYKKYQNIVNEESDLAKKQETYTQLKQRIAELQTTIDEAHIRLSTEIEQKSVQLNELNSLSNSQLSLEQEKIDLESKETELDKKEQEFQAITERGLNVRSLIENIGTQIIEQGKRQQEYKNKIEELNKATDLSHCPLCSAPIVDRAAVIARYENSIQESQTEVINLEHEKHKLEEERLLLLNKHKELKTELEQRKSFDMQKGQFKEKFRALSEATERKENLSKEIKTLTKQKEENNFATIQRTSLINLTANLNELQFDPVLYANIQAQMRSQRGIEARYFQLKKDLSEISQIESTLPELQNKIDSFKIILSEESYATDVRENMRTLDKQYQIIDYDNNLHNELKEKLVLLMPKMDKYKDLKRALNEIPIVEKNLKDTQSWLNNKKEQQIALNQDYEKTFSSINELPQVEAGLLALKSKLKDIQNEYENLVQEEAKLSAHLERLINEAENFKTKKDELSETRNAYDDYLYLAECFGKKGIQAIIIENAIPEIEIDANRLLSRLTDNKMHISLITQQKSKTGNVSETLDIVISDDLGTRSYELYSGGEAFKVNFAIRVALSRLLARRAGAKLETLIIDEGFGSQDDNSRDKLVKAIHSIQPDFARILVITHFADVKEMFPTHIQINKSSGVSQIELIN